MAYTDPGPTSSYSDPIYDRLDTMSKAVKRRWWVYLLAFVLVLVASIVARTALTERSDQASAIAYTEAFDSRDPLANTDAFKDLAQNQKADPYYRARAWIELVQSRIDAGEADGAKTAAEQALVEAKRSGDGELIAYARLSQAAADFQRNDFESALANYQAVVSSAARFPVAQLEATLGEARCYEQQHQLPDAISTLEPLLTRTDAGAADLIGLARVQYWNDRRLQEQATTGTASRLGVPATASSTAAVVRAPATVQLPMPEARPGMAPAPAPAQAPTATQPARAQAAAPAAPATPAH